MPVKGIINPVARYESARNLSRLNRVMARHKLKQSEVGYLLNVTRTTVNKWFRYLRKCPDTAPERLSAICDIRSQESIRAEIHRKRSCRNEAPNEAPCES